MRNTASAWAVIDEIKRRQALNYKLESSFNKFVVISDNRKLLFPRGEIHKLVALDAGIVLNQKTVRIIKDFIESKGAMPCISRGRLYYRYMGRK